MAFTLKSWIIALALCAWGLSFGQELSAEETPAVATETGALSEVPAPASEPAMTRTALPDSVMPEAINKSAETKNAPVVQQQMQVTPSQSLVINNQNMFRKQFLDGQSTQRLGRILSWGGLAASVLGNSMGNPTLSGLGGLALLVGIPVNGTGSSKMVRAANELNPTAHVEHRGWAPYFTGVGLMVGGVLVMVDAVSSEDEYDDDLNVQQLVTGALMVVAGDICMYVSWYKFSASADDADAAFSAVQLSGGPLLIPEVQGNGFAKGIQMVAAF